MNMWNLLARFYDRALRPEEAAYKRADEWVRGHIEGMTVLETAAGTGRCAVNVHEKAKSYAATDFSETMIKKAAKKPHKNNLTFAVADAARLPYPDAAFDRVLVSNALHLFPNAEKALSEAARVLKKDGRLLIVNYLSAEETARERRAKRLMRLAGVAPQRAFTEQSLAEFLQKNGWQTEDALLIPSRLMMMCVCCKKK